MNYMNLMRACAQKTFVQIMKMKSVQNNGKIFVAAKRFDILNL